MDRILARLERRLGRFAIPKLTTFIVGGMAIVFVLAMMKPAFLGLLTFDAAKVMHGEVWRIFTFLFIPPEASLFWIFFSLYWTWLVGTNLEQEWGPFKLNAYYFLGAIGTIVAAFVTGAPAGNTYLNLSLFFAFATIFPNYQILILFVLPVRVKWLALLSAAGLIYPALVGSWGTRAAIAAAILNYFLFFGAHLVGMLKHRNLEVRQAARRNTHSLAPKREALVGRACAICGALEDDGVDIRVCSCEKCGGKPRTLCLEHARNH